MQEKLRRRIASIDVKVLNPPRPGKKCLVLDIDYTLFDLVRALYLTICLEIAFPGLCLCCCLLCNLCDLWCMCHSQVVTYARLVHQSGRNFAEPAADANFAVARLLRSSCYVHASAAAVLYC